MPSNHGFMKCLKASFFFVGYFEYFKPGPVQCLNKLWHWAIFTLSLQPPTTYWCPLCAVRGDFHWKHPDLNHVQTDKRFLFLGGGERQFWVLGTTTVAEGMKYTLDLNRTLDDPRPNKVESTTQVRVCEMFGKLIWCNAREWDETNSE